jgi:uncharacterized protein (TIGR02391 family)
MTHLSCFDASQLEAACRVLADTGDGLSGTEIGYVLQEIEVPDPDPNYTKWKRLFNALSAMQNKHHVGNHLIMFINKAMEPARHVSKAGRFHWLQDNLNVALSLSGYAVRDDGKVIRTTRETTVNGALARAKRLHTMLEQRGTHAEVFAYCNAELLEQNYFHAVFEAVKGVGDRLRKLSGLTTDGGDLITQALNTKAPILALNALKTETEISEQKGIVNLLIGLFGAVRNPIAHAPKLTWAMQEQDALDIFGLISYVHRKLDGAIKV